MDFSYNEEQRILRDGLSRFLDKEYTQESRRVRVSSNIGYSKETWGVFAELGLLGLPFDARYGGFAGSGVDTLSVMEAFGRALVVEPYVATVVLGGGLIDALGSDAQREQWLPPISAGQKLLAFAQAEAPARYALNYVTTSAARAGESFVLNGAKIVVLHGGQADQLIVSARSAGAAGDRAGISLFMVDPRQQGVSVRDYATIDGLRAADVRFDNVKLERAALLGEIDNALPAIEAITDRAIAALCAEALGAMAALNEITLAYLKTRHQFGVPIGTFQALQHRMVDMLIHYEQAKSLGYLAALHAHSGDANNISRVRADEESRGHGNDISRVRADEESRGHGNDISRVRAVSSAKVQVGEAARFIAQQAVQLHGGMGMTDELNVGHYVKRLTMINQTFGDVDFHVMRFAAATRSN